MYTVSRTLQNLTIPSNKVVIEDFTERLWAYMKIKQLLVKLLLTDDSRERARLKSEALQMSLQYNFVTPLTSLIVVESDSYDELDMEFAMGKADGAFLRNAVSNRLTAPAGWRLLSSGVSVLIIFFTSVRF